MPRHPLTTDDRRIAAAKTNATIKERKRQRIEKVRHLHRDGKTLAEIAAQLGVSERTIRRDLKTLEAAS